MLAVSFGFLAFSAIRVSDTNWPIALLGPASAPKILFLEMLHHTTASVLYNFVNFALKCAMHNGPAFLHYFSTDNRNSIILLGPTVNFASRLEGIAKEDEIIVSEPLRNMVQGKFQFLEIMIKDRVKEESRKGKIKSFEEEGIVYSLTTKK